MNLLGSSNTNILPGRGLVNPAFVIKIVAATDDLQQKPIPGRENPNNDYLDNLSVGDSIEADINGKWIEGNVKRIIRNDEGDGIFVVFSDLKGRTRKVDGSRIRRIESSAPDDRMQLVSSPATFENFLGYRRFTCM